MYVTEYSLSLNHVCYRIEAKMRSCVNIMMSESAGCSLDDTVTAFRDIRLRQGMLTGTGKCGMQLCVLSYYLIQLTLKFYELQNPLF
jgi:hypothetical protein